MGLETGSGKLLKKIQKGITPEEFSESCAKAKDAGFEISLYVLLGLGGEDMWEEHAMETAAILNRINPHYIRVRTLQPQPCSEIFTDMKEGRFKKASPETVLNEQKKIIENAGFSSHYLSDHLTNYIPLNGVLPKDRQKMLSCINESLAALKDDPAVQERFYRKDRIRGL